LKVGSACVIIPAVNEMKKPTLIFPLLAVLAAGATSETRLYQERTGPKTIVLEWARQPLPVGSRVTLKSFYDLFSFE